MAGCTFSAGELPALNAWNRPSPHRIIAHSAMMLRAELRVHKKRILFGGPDDFSFLSSSRVAGFARAPQLALRYSTTLSIVPTRAS